MQSFCESYPQFSFLLLHPFLQRAAMEKENIVMFPYMAQGHIITFLALAIEIEKKRGCCNITFVTTPLNLKKLQASIPSNSSIVLHEIPFCSSDHGLPPNTDNTDVIPQSLMASLDEASFSLKIPFRNLISKLVQGGPPPVCVIADIFLGWTAEIAHEFGIFHSIFCAGSGFGMAYFYSLWLSVPHLDPNSDGEISLPDFPEASNIHITQMSENLRAADGADTYSLFNKEALSDWKKSDGVLFNSVEELDTLGLAYFRRKIGRPVWPVGPVLLTTGNAVQEAKTMAGFYREWLDERPPNSVLYIAFGSQNSISAAQMIQLALALEVSGKSFIWVIRAPLGVDGGDSKWLPEGFEQRIKDENRGLLVQKWAPQVEILSHRSISAFLSHCGWNSVVEAISHGVPMIGWPLSAEQFYNVKFLEEEMGVCVEVARGPVSEVRQEEIVRKIGLVMNATEKRKDMRNKICGVRDMMKDAIRDEEGFRGSSVKAMDEFFHAAFSMREKTKGGPHKKGQKK